MATTASALTNRVGRIGLAGVLVGIVGLAITLAVGGMMLANSAGDAAEVKPGGWMTMETYLSLRQHQAAEYGRVTGSAPGDVWLKLRQHHDREYGAGSAGLTPAEIAARQRDHVIRENGRASGPSGPIDIPAALRDHREREYGAR